MSKKIIVGSTVSFKFAGGLLYGEVISLLDKLKVMVVETDNPTKNYKHRVELSKLTKL
jgi:hypothetical protein